MSTDWSKAFPNNASPYYSFPAFLVHAGNPKHVKNWPAQIFVRPTDLEWTSDGQGIAASSLAPSIAPAGGG